MGKKLVCATNNAGKLREIRDILRPLGFEVLSGKDCGLHLEPEETGMTFEENALLKASAMAQASGLAALADDSGLMVDALDGAPGVHSARYGGKKSDKERNSYLLGNIKHIPASKRGAAFVCCICCIFPDGSTLTARGECRGTLLFEPMGEGGFGYDPIFFIPELGKTMAQLFEREKNAVSHRARALHTFLNEMEKQATKFQY